VTLVLGLEGLDGVGKSTIANMLVAYCESQQLRCCVVRNGGSITKNEGIDEKSDRSNLERYWLNLITLKLANQHEIASECAKNNDVVILDRTFLSHLMGKTRIYKQHSSEELVRTSLKYLQSKVKPFVDFNALWLVSRPFEDSIRIIKERKQSGEKLAIFEEIALENPQILPDDFEKLKKMCNVFDCSMIENNSDMALLKYDVEKRIKSLL
jgi:thymidylate kinase